MCLHLFTQCQTVRAISVANLWDFVAPIPLSALLRAGCGRRAWASLVTFYFNSPRFNSVETFYDPTVSAIDGSTSARNAFRILCGAVVIKFVLFRFVWWRAPVCAQQELLGQLIASAATQQRYMSDSKARVVAAVALQIAVSLGDAARWCLAQWGIERRKDSFGKMSSFGNRLSPLIDSIPLPRSGAFGWQEVEV